MSGVETVRVVTEHLAREYGKGWADIEADHNDPPGGTTDYDGRALAFIVEVDGYQIRVLVEDVTIDEENPDLA